MYDGAMLRELTAIRRLLESIDARLAVTSTREDPTR